MWFNRNFFRYGVYMTETTIYDWNQQFVRNQNLFVNLLLCETGVCSGPLSGTRSITCVATSCFLHCSASAWHGWNQTCNLCMWDVIPIIWGVKRTFISWFTDIGKSFTDIGKWITDIGKWFTDIGKWFTDIGKWITDIGKSSYLPISVNILPISVNRLDLPISVNHLPISVNRFIYRYR